MTARLELVLYLAAAVLASLALLIVRSSPAIAVSGPAKAVTAEVSRDESAAETRSTAIVVARNPFRLDRSPSPILFRSVAEQAIQQAMPVMQQPRPALTLRAVVGPPWEALVEGLPGRSGVVVVRAGDKVGDLTIRLIRGDSVVIQGADTTWRLGISRAWQ